MHITNSLKKMSKKKKNRIIALSIAAGLGTTSAMSVAANAKNITITDGDSVIKLRTLNSEPKEVVRQAGINISNEDKLIVTNQENKDVNIDIKRVFSVSLNYDGEKHTYSVNEGTLGDLIKKENISLNSHDFLSHSLDTVLTPDMDIKIDRAKEIVLNVDDQTSTEYVPEGTVEDTLKFLNVSVNKYDIVNVANDQFVENGLNITINRVKYKETVEKIAIPFTTTEVKTDKLEKGASTIQTKGENGEKEIVKRAKYIDGTLAQEDVVSEKVTKAPVNEVKLIGTKINPPKISRTVETISKGSSYKIGNVVTDNSGKSYKIKSVHTGKCSAYTHTGQNTASGKRPTVGMVAANNFPIGTKILLNGRIYTVEDTGGFAKYGRVLDIFMNSEDECNRYGVQTETFAILA